MIEVKIWLILIRQRVRVSKGAAWVLRAGVLSAFRMPDEHDLERLSFIVLWLF